MTKDLWLALTEIKMLKFFQEQVTFNNMGVIELLWNSSHMKATHVAQTAIQCQSYQDTLQHIGKEKIIRQIIAYTDKGSKKLE